MNDATMCTLKTLVILQEHLYTIYNAAPDGATDAGQLLYCTLCSLYKLQLTRYNLNK